MQTDIFVTDSPSSRQSDGIDGIEDLEKILEELLDTAPGEDEILQKYKHFDVGSCIPHILQYSLNFAENANLHQLQVNIGNHVADIYETRQNLRQLHAESTNYQNCQNISSNFDQFDNDISECSLESWCSLQTPSAIDRDFPIDHSEFGKSKTTKLYRFNPKPLTLKPSMSRGRKYNSNTENEDEEYKEKRRRNNEASRRSRMARRYKECIVMEEMQKLRKENEELKNELKLLKKLNTIF